MTKIQNSKLYDLEERTFQFGKTVRIFVKHGQRHLKISMMVFALF